MMMTRTLDVFLLLAGSMCLVWNASLVLTLGCIVFIKISMDFIEGSRGIYRPIKIALMTELLKLQQRKQLPSELTAEDMSELPVEQSESTLKVGFWESALEDFDETDAKPLLKLVWDVNTNMKMRDDEFEARRLLCSPKAIPHQFQHLKISQAQMYARILFEQKQQVAPSSKLLHPREVVMEVAPKLLQGFWLPPLNTSFNMPSQQLIKMAAGVTKAADNRVSTALSAMLHHATFSRSIRDYMVLYIWEKVRQGYTLDILVKKLNRFEAEVLNTFTDVAAKEICVLFHSQTQTKVSVYTNTKKACIQPAHVVKGAETGTISAEDEDPDSEEDTVPIRETVSAVIAPPSAPLTISAGPPAHTAIHSDLNSSFDANSAVIYSPHAPLTLPAKAPADKALQTTKRQVEESFYTTTEVKQTEMSGFSCFLSWLQQNLCCCFLPADDAETE